ncbi:uncharacterized protein [Ambystoma mexicanum]|uniref:uncharacterized protein n=1 Tax=Ambystoma mexicanum TaxID=8296 RepID=UPI0037E81E11
MEKTHGCILVFLLVSTRNHGLPESVAQIHGHDHFSSTFDLLCTEFSKAYSYCWCNTLAGWDYCSFDRNSTHDEKQCKSDHTCGKHGKKYSWCFTEDGKWGYCGRVAPKAEPEDLVKIVGHMTPYYLPCQNECGKGMGKDYFWCYTTQGWDYCSPLPQVTVRNQPCRADFPCALHGKSYYWCYTVGSDWDYCGPIQAAECHYKELDSGRSVQHRSEYQLMCSERTETKITQTYFLLNPVAPWMDGTSYYDEAVTELISAWNNSFLTNHSQRVVLTSGKLNLRMHRISTHDKEPYHHYQIEVAVPTLPGAPIAQVLIPEKKAVSERYIRRAFMESLVRSSGIRISVLQY